MIFNHCSSKKKVPGSSTDISTQNLKREKKKKGKKKPQEIQADLIETLCKNTLFCFTVKGSFYLFLKFCRDFSC